MILTGLSILGAAIENANISYIMPFVKCDLKLTIGQQGALLSVSFLATISTYFWGFLADTWGRRKVMSIAAFSGFFFSFLSGFMTNIHVLIVLRFLASAM